MSRILIVLLAMSAVAGAVDKKIGSTKIIAPEKAVTQKDGVGQEHNFEDLLVQGKYHFSDEAVTTVEEDKVLDSLLGIRADFKDRMAKSAGQY